MPDKPGATIDKPATPPIPGKAPETGKEGVDSGKPGADPKGQKPDAAGAVSAGDAAIKKFLLKGHDGKDIEITDEKELVRRAQLGIGAEKAIQEFKELQRQMGELYSILKEPKTAFQVFKKLGMDPHKLAEDLIYEQIKMESMDPKEREALEWRRKAEENAKRVEEYEKKAAAHQLESLTAHFKSDYERRVIDAMEKSDLPKNKHTARMILEEIAGAVSRGEDVPEASRLAEMVNARYRELASGFFTNRDAKTIAELLGVDLRKKLRELDLAEIQPAGGGEKPPTPEPDSKKEDLHPLSRKSWLEKRESVEERLRRIKESQE